MCNFWNKGFCREGSSCSFDHPQEDCQDHIHSGGCKDPCCPLRHRSVCKHWSRGQCPKGNKCQFLHKNRINGNSRNRRSYSREKRSTRSKSHSREEQNIRSNSYCREDRNRSYSDRSNIRGYYSSSSESEDESS